MKRLMLGLMLLLLATACGTAEEAELDPNANADGDCMTDMQELERGTDPDLADSDGDGVSDCAELECVSNPMDAEEKCYTCGWKHNDPGRLVSNGSAVGDVVDDRELTDQCNDTVSLWDFYGEYHVMYMTAAW